MNPLEAVQRLSVASNSAAIGGDTFRTLDTVSPKEPPQLGTVFTRTPVLNARLFTSQSDSPYDIALDRLGDLHHRQDIITQ